MRICLSLSSNSKIQVTSTSFKKKEKSERASKKETRIAQALFRILIIHNFINKKISSTIENYILYLSFTIRTLHVFFTMSAKPKFIKPSLELTGNERLDSERMNEVEAEKEIAKFNPNADLSYDVQRQRLPVYKYRDHILYALETHRVVIIVAETGGGKSTQIPQYLYENNWTSSNKMICVIGKNLKKA